MKSVDAKDWNEIFGISLLLVEFDDKMRIFMRTHGEFEIDEENPMLATRLSWSYTMKGKEKESRIFTNLHLGSMFIPTPEDLEQILNTHFQAFLNLTLFRVPRTLEQDMRTRGEWEIIMSKFNDNFYMTNGIWRYTYGTTNEDEELHESGGLSFDVKGARDFMGGRESFSHIYSRSQTAIRRFSDNMFPIDD